MPASFLDHALRHARRGFRVFPLVANGKAPAIREWPERATTDEAAIEDWWSERPNLNIGIATGRGVLVLDADVKGGTPGLESLALLADFHDLPTSYRVRTASGGVHVYLSVPEGAGLRNTVKALSGFPGIDVRADGGFVVAEGSVVDGVEYEALA